MPGHPFKYVEGAQVREGQQRNIFHSNWRGVGGTRIYLWNVVGGYLAGLLHPDPKEILVIGYGSGRQVATLVSLPGPRRIDVVEVNPLNFEASDYFYLSSAQILRDPRVHVYVDDGRNHLLRSRRSYDVILVDVGGIDVDGGEFLYTREFLELCREHLAPGGLVFTWMDIRRLVQPVGASYRKTLRELFPEASLWLGTAEQTSYGWLWLIGAKEPLTIDMERLRQRWSALTPTQRAELDLAGVQEPSVLASLYLSDLSEPGATVPGARTFTDDRPYCKPIGEAGNPASTQASEAPIDTSFLRQVLDTATDPALTGATDAEVAVLRERRSYLRRMVRKGTGMGPFRFLADPIP
jgi:spermidine synthase